MEPFDFERGLEQTVGQPVEPPSSMPAAGRKNYRMARQSGSTRPLLADTQHADSVPTLAARPVHEGQRLRLPAPV